jgi:ribonucleotide reductase beta subunit family protein with ferritin-like domain
MSTDDTPSDDRTASIDDSLQSNTVTTTDRGGVSDHTVTDASGSDIFSKRTQINPDEYPDFADYKDAIRNSYWVHDEFNFSGDVQDFKLNTTPAEQTVIKRTMLAIAQIEVQVKTF